MPHPVKATDYDGCKVLRRESFDGYEVHWHCIEHEWSCRERFTLKSSADKAATEVRQCP